MFHVHEVVLLKAPQIKVLGEQEPHGDSSVSVIMENGFQALLWNITALRLYRGVP